MEGYLIFMLLACLALTGYGLGNDKLANRGNGFRDSFT